MKAAFLLLALGGVALADDADTKSLISFPGPRWVENNDPVMGGKSTGNWSVVDNSYGLFQGTVKNISAQLNAPGFCRAVTVGLFSRDASDYLDGGIVLTVRTTTPEFKGFRLSFGSLGTPMHHGGHEIEGSFKADFSVPAGEEWQSVYLPFKSFSYDWSDFSGSCETKDPDGYQHKCCSDANSEVCPTAARTKHINSFNIWAEGAEGDFHLEMKEIAATKKAPAASAVVLV